MAEVYKVEDITVETAAELEIALDAIGVASWKLIQFMRWILPLDVPADANIMTFRCVFSKTV